MVAGRRCTGHRLDPEEHPAPVRRRDDVRRPDRPGPGARGVAGRRPLLLRDDREPHHDRAGPRRPRLLCREAGVLSAVDNTFASPYLCNPVALGFDVALHSATKYVGGHADLIGGVACTSEELFRRLRDTVIDLGGSMPPLEAWLCLRGLATPACGWSTTAPPRRSWRRRWRRTRPSSTSTTRVCPTIRSTRSRRDSSATSAARSRSRSPAGSSRQPGRGGARDRLDRGASAA